MTDSSATKHYADLVIAARGLGERLIDTGIVDAEQLRFTIVARDERKRVVPALKASGMSNREIARQLGVAEGTIRNDLAPAQNYAPNAQNSAPDPVREAERQAAAERLEAEDVEREKRETLLRLAEGALHAAGAFAVAQLRSGLIERLEDRKFASMLAQRCRLGVEGAPTIKEMLIGAQELAKILRGVQL